MGSLDVPEVLIGLGLLAGLCWAVYNWRHPGPPRGSKGSKKMGQAA